MKTHNEMKKTLHVGLLYILYTFVECKFCKLNIYSMGRKLKLGTQRKNEKRKRQSLKIHKIGRPPKVKWLELIPAQQVYYLAALKSF